MYCMILYSIMCWEILRYAYLCFFKVCYLCEERIHGPVGLLGLLGSRSLQPELPFPDENHSLGVYFIKGWRGFYFSELSKYYIICTERDKTIFHLHMLLCLCM